ncbi:MAG: CvpA family protein [Ignavibacteriaceae bacterium]|nr:CvpA family protein [Ignavibacteriaceae bacterium]
MWMDLCLIAVLLFSIIDGFKKGLIKALVHFAGWIAAAFFAMKAYPVVAHYMTASSKIYSSINEKISDKLMVQTGTQPGTADALSNFKLPGVIQQTITHAISSSENMIAGTASELIAKVCINIISLIIVFVAVKIVISIVAAGIGRVGKLPVLKQCDQLAGSVVGFIKGFMIIFIILAVMVPAMSIMKDDFLIKSLRSAPLTEYFYDHNLLFIVVKDYI